MSNIPGPYAAWSRSNGWVGPARKTLAAAQQDADDYRAAQVKQGGYEGAVVCAEDPGTPGRTVEAEDGTPVWPSHGRSTGTVGW